MRVFLIILIVLGSFSEANALRDPASNDENKNKPIGGNGDYLKANCPPSDAKLFLEFNDVRALVEAGGALWQNRQTGTASYEVPWVEVTMLFSLDLFGWEGMTLMVN